MTGYPPDDGFFPGRPGEPPFPGPPGGPPPHQHHPSPPPQPGPYGPPARQGPPQQPWVPGYPGQPGPPPRGSRRGLWIGIGAAAAVLLVAGTGFTIWSVAEARPYAALPSCGALLPDELLGTVPGADRPSVAGEFFAVEDPEYYEGTDEGYLGALECAVWEGSGEHLLSVHVDLYDAEDGVGGVEDRQEELEDVIADLEEGRYGEELWDGEIEADVLAWDALSAGDGGYAVVAEVTSEWIDGDVFADAYFGSANAAVSVSYLQEGRVDEEELVDFLDVFAGEVDRQLSREGERV